MLEISACCMNAQMRKDLATSLVATIVATMLPNETHPGRPGRPRSGAPLRPVSLAADEVLVRRLERLRMVLLEREPWSRPTRSSAARAALDAGLAALLGREEPAA